MATSAARTAILLDPHPLWLDAVADVLERAGVEVRGTATEPDEAHALLAEHNPDLFVAEPTAYDGRLDTAGAIRVAREHAPAVRVVVLSSIADPEEIARGLGAGAVAYVIKPAEAKDFAAAVRDGFGRFGVLPGEQS